MMRTYYQKLKDKGLSVLMVTRMLKKANVLSSRGNHFAQRTIQDYFDSNFEAVRETTQIDMDLVLEKVEIILSWYDSGIKKLKNEDIIVTKS